jgi:hypothetical protein
MAMKPQEPTNYTVIDRIQSHSSYIQGLKKEDTQIWNIIKQSILGPSNSEHVRYFNILTVLREQHKYLLETFTTSHARDLALRPLKF